MELIEYLEKLEIHENKKEWDELLKLSEEAVGNFPYSQTLKIYKIRALIEKERLNEAKFLCEELIKTNPGSSIIHSLLANIYERRGDFKRAIDEHDKILFLNPGDDKSIAEIERLKKLLAEDGEEIESEVEVKEEKGVMEEEKLKERKEIINSSKESPEEQDIEEKNLKVEKDKIFENEDELVQEKKSSIFEEMRTYKIEEETDDNFRKKLELSSIGVKEENNKKNEEPANSEYVSGEDIYTTVSMADILEKQGKFYEAQKIFYKLYKKDKSLVALRGYKRTGLKFYESILNKLNRRINRSV